MSSVIQSSFPASFAFNYSLIPISGYPLPFRKPPVSHPTKIATTLSQCFHCLLNPIFHQAKLGQTLSKRGYRFISQLEMRLVQVISHCGAWCFVACIILSAVLAFEEYGDDIYGTSGDPVLTIYGNQIHDECHLWNGFTNYNAYVVGAIAPSPIDGQVADISQAVCVNGTGMHVVKDLCEFFWGFIFVVLKFDILHIVESHM